MYIKETGHLRRMGGKRSCKVGKQKGFFLAEKGGASGTIKGALYLKLCVTSTKHVVAKVGVYPHGGSITGYGSANYGVHGGYAHFSGSMSINKGSGKFKGAHGSNLKFSGSIKRSNDAVSVSLSGRLYL